MHHCRRNSPTRRIALRGVIVLELLMALPIFVIMTDLVVRLTFDAAFMTGLSYAAIEAAREGSQVFPASLPVEDPQGISASGRVDGDDVADRIARVVERRLRLLRLRVISPDDLSHAERTPSAASVSLLRVLIRQGVQARERGDRSIPVRWSAVPVADDEIEVLIAVRLAGAARDASATANAASRSWFFPDVVQASARMPLE